MVGVIDVWANWWDAAFFAAHDPMRKLYERLDMQDRMSLTADAVRDEAQRAGVAKLLLSATAFPGSPVGNRAVASVVRQHPDVFYGCASVDPRDGMVSVRDLRRAVQQDGFVALKVLPFLYGLPPDDAIYFPLYAACVDLGIPVLILTGHTAVKLPNETGRPGHLDAVALHFPELKIVAGHAGYPWTTELIALAWKHENLFIDTSGHRPRHFPPELVRFMNSYGRGKVLFGTGYPMMDYAGPLEEVAAMDLKPTARDAFLAGNALTIWPQWEGTA